MAEVDRVQAEINRQIAIFIAWDTKYGPQIEVERLAAGLPDLRERVLLRIDDLPKPPSGELFRCGRGLIDYVVTKVQVELTSTVDSSRSAGLSLTIPVGPASLGPSFDASRAVTNSQVLRYNLWPFDTAAPENAAARAMKVDQQGLENTPLARVLVGLRSALIKQDLVLDYGHFPYAERPPKPCYTNYNRAKPSEDAGNFFTLGLTVVKEANGAIKVGMGPVSASGGLGWKSTTGHTITVTFVQPHLDGLQYLQDAVDKECGYPNQASARCRQAVTDRTTGYHVASRRSGGVGQARRAGLATTSEPSPGTSNERDIGRGVLGTSRPLEGFSLTW